VLALIALFIVFSLAEIYVIALVGHAIGALNTIGLLLLFSIGGAWVATRVGLGVLSRLRAQLDAGRMPTNELIDAGLVLTGGILLLVPGFVTDAIGILLLLPPVRALVRTFVKRRFGLRVYRTINPRRDDGPPDVIDV